MSERNGRALDVALAYHDAWTSKDLDRAMTYIADDIVCDAPAGRIGVRHLRVKLGESLVHPPFPLDRMRAA